MRSFSVPGGLAIASLAMALVVPTFGQGANAATSIPAVSLGSSESTAAGSCWEIKQKQDGAASGPYWLLTPAMAEPSRFYCDMTTDGGGWVLVGKGRDGWSEGYTGLGDPADLLEPGLSPMGPKTTQLSSHTIDGLLNNGRVDALDDGVRLLRATDTSGTSWQEARVKFQRRDRWVWTWGAEHPLASWSFDKSSGSGGLSKNFGSDQNYQRVVSSPLSSQGYRVGYGFGNKVSGSSSSTSYLWSKTDGATNALPYTEMYLRPKVMSDAPGFTVIPDSGTTPRTMPTVVKDRALDSPWGVTGIAGNTLTEGNVEVQTFTQSGNTMYVGGNFAYVQRDETGAGRVSQPFLAAFDVTTGEFVSSFRPSLNEQVHALETLPDGSIVAAGEFTVANGSPATAVVALDPTTGQTRSNWRATVMPTSSGPVRINALKVKGDWLYLAGSFSKIAGGSAPTTFRWAKNLGRVAVADGTAGRNWNPKLNGTVTGVDTSPDGQTVYASGFFGKAGTVTARRAVALSAAAGAAVTPAFTPTWSSTKKDYQRAVLVASGRVYFGGSEHSLFGFTPETMSRVSGSILKRHGDIQVIAPGAGSTIYAGCHCNNYSYENAFTWSTLSPEWTEADAMGWFGAWDATTGARIPDFVPAMRMRLGSGIWALQQDTAGNMWAGGDIASATTKSKAGKWAGGFVRFDAADAEAPPTPLDFRVDAVTADTVTLSWSRVGDSSGVHYQILRDDRTIATTGSGATTSITVPLGGDNRFFVRAQDGAGNVSPSSTVVQPSAG